MFDCPGILDIARGDLEPPLAAFVANHPLSGGDLALEPVGLTTYLNVTLPRRKGPIYPHEPIVVNWNPKFVGHPRPTGLVGEPLGAWNFSLFVDSAVNAVNRNVFVGVAVIPQPNNLQ
jgi:hypothetical protein